MNEAPVQPVRVEARPVGKVEQAKAKVKELTLKGKEWFKDKWDKVTSKPREVLNDINISVPTKKEDYFATDLPNVSKKDKKNFPTESKDKIITRFFKFFEKKGKSDPQFKLPEPGYGFDFPSNWQDASTYSEGVLYGDKLRSGGNGKIYLDKSSGELTHLWKKYISPEIARQNAHQMELYHKLNGKHPFFEFVREVPGGWTTKYIENQGDLKEYIQKGGKLTPEQVDRAVENLRKMQELSGEAHGDIVRRKEFSDDFHIGLAQMSWDSIEATGFVNFQNIIIDKNGEIIILDYAGNSDPASTTYGEDRHNSKSPEFMKNELKFFEEGLKSLVKTKNPTEVISEENIESTNEQKFAKQTEFVQNLLKTHLKVDEIVVGYGNKNSNQYQAFGVYRETGVKWGSIRMGDAPNNSDGKDYLSQKILDTELPKFSHELTHVIQLSRSGEIKTPDSPIMGILNEGLACAVELYAQNETSGKKIDIATVADHTRNLVTNNSDILLNPKSRFDSDTTLSEDELREIAFIKFKFYDGFARSRGMEYVAGTSFVLNVLGDRLDKWTVIYDNPPSLEEIVDPNKYLSRMGEIIKNFEVSDIQPNKPAINSSHKQS